MIVWPRAIVRHRLLIRTLSSTGLCRQRSPVDNYLETVKPHLNKAHSLYQTTKDRAQSVIGSFKFHYYKAKQSIQDVNTKLAQQEKELAAYDFDEDFTQKNGGDNTKIEGLPSQRERRRKLWAKRFELYFDSLQETIFTATRALNDVTGYSAIQKLRESIDALGDELAKAKEEAKSTKELYQEVVSERMETQKEVNDLLQRKASWSPADLERFTTLYKNEHVGATREQSTKAAMVAAEQRQEELYDKLSSAMLTRYHEEQIWSDKIRRASTWGTFGIMGLNIFLFLIFQLALEPWKRRRLVGNFEEKVQKVLEENSSQQNQRLDAMTALVDELRGEGLPILEERMRNEVLDDIEDEVVPPRVIDLPLPIDNTWKSKVKAAAGAIISPLKEPFRLLTCYDTTVLHKNEFISSLSLALSTGVLIGWLMFVTIK